jgi:multicomponent Na+:H+ antiporter subunit E
MTGADPSRERTLKYPISLSLVLYAVWLLWSGHFGGLLLVLGALSCLAVVVIAMRMRVVDSEGAPIEHALRALVYVPWLLWEIAKANFDVARRILDPRLPIDPRVIRVRASQRRDLARVIYANSITLTPGTVSIDVAGDRITVHALTREAAEGLAAGEMDRRVSRVEGP